METLEFRGEKFYFEETPQSKALIGEVFGDNYKVFERRVKFEPGDVVLDIGACEGMFSVMIAKLYPFVKVISLEPVPRTFWHLIRNIGLNGLLNVDPHAMGVGKEDDSKREFAIGQDDHNGGSSGVMTFNERLHEKVTVPIVSLDNLFDMLHLEDVKLLKMDIEGMEHEAIIGSKALKEVRNFVGEIHINGKLAAQGRDITELATLIGSQTNLLYYQPCIMEE